MYFTQEGIGLGIGLKAKVKWDNIAKAFASAGVAATVYKFSGDVETAATAGGYVKDALDMVDVYKKEKSPASYFLA